MKKIKWFSSILLLIIIALFFSGPFLNDKWYFINQVSVKINNTPNVVKDVINDITLYKNWLQLDTPKDSCLISYSKSTTGANATMTYTSIKNSSQKTTVVLKSYEINEQGLIEFGYNINNTNDTVSYYGYIVPDHVLIVSGGDANTVDLTFVRNYNFENAPFFTKLKLGWKKLLGHKDEVDPELLQEANRLKAYIEDNIGRLLDDRE